MSATDKMRNRIQIAWGRANVHIGRLTGDRSRQRRGHRQQVGATMRQAGERLKDAVHALFDTFRRLGLIERPARHRRGQ
jgi:uncharacterized protein YjbJ (UPF0337 family)